MAVPKSATTNNNFNIDYKNTKQENQHEYRYSITLRDAISDFQCNIAASGLRPPDHIVPDGKLHRFASNGKPNDTAGWYVFFVHPFPAGVFGCWRNDITIKWRADIGRNLTIEEEHQINQKIYKEINELKNKKDVSQKHAAIQAKEQWNAIHDANPNHPYLVKKGIPPYGIRQNDNILIIPIYINNEISSLQFIHAGGEKRYLKNAEKKGGYFTIGEIKNGFPICIAEGYATAASIHMATYYPVAVAFDATNIKPVAETLKKIYPDSTIVICADDDSENKTGINIGVIKAKDAAESINAIVAIPDFGKNRPPKASDFNDMYQAKGPDTVRQCIEEAIYGRPQQLIQKIWPRPYPLDALPTEIKKAVEEVFQYTQAPLPLVASSALSSLALAGQGHVNESRSEDLYGPVSLFFLIIANSGERKSTVDRFFFEGLRNHDTSLQNSRKSREDKYRDDLKKWEAKNKGLLKKIEEQTKKGIRTDFADEEYLQLMNEKPEKPKIPRHIYTDVTPEELAFSLCFTWPSGGIISAEGAAVLGSYGMSVEVIERNLARLNSLWSGEAITIDRRTSESFTVANARLMISIQIQEAGIRSFFEKKGNIVRGLGFLSRFLISFPDSTKGSRFYKKSEAKPHLDKYRQKLLQMLESISTDNDGNLEIVTLKPTHEAKDVWIDFYNSIEKMLAPRNKLSDIDDIASKAAENASRLATLLHFFCHGKTDICRDCMCRATQIIEWHLHEARRFFGEISMPKELMDMLQIERFLRNKKTPVNTGIILQYSSVRTKAEMDVALKGLTEKNRIRIIRQGRSRIVYLNPLVFEE